MLRTRLLSAVVLGPLVVVAVLAGDPWVTLVVAIALLLGLIELSALLDAGGFEPPRTVLVLVGLAVAAAGLVSVGGLEFTGPTGELVRRMAPVGLPWLTMVAALVLLAVAAFSGREPGRAYLSWATSSLGVAYLALLAPFLVALAHLAPPGGNEGTPVGAVNLASGKAWLLLLLALVWSYDSGAYFVGRRFGRRRLLERISPSKTVEGLVGGLAVATAVGAVGMAAVGIPAWHGLLIGPLVGLAAQAGDLAESSLKRAAGRKESSRLIPGHGGVLDRIDSFLFAAPALTVYALLFTEYAL
jgi:phosphatidate cytidylyltransferase